jgi:hypothetical protein
MPALLSDQKQDIERALREPNLTRTVRDALEAQLATINKKIIAKSGRRATLQDGTVVTVGSKVWRGWMPEHEYSYEQGKSIKKPARVSSSVIRKISADGSEIGFSEEARSHMLPAQPKDHYLAHAYFGTAEAAKSAILNQYERDVRVAQRNFDDAKKKLEEEIAERDAAASMEIKTIDQYPTWLEGSQNGN